MPVNSALRHACQGQRKSISSPASTQPAQPALPAQPTQPFFFSLKLVIWAPREIINLLITAVRAKGVPLESQKYQHLYKESATNPYAKSVVRQR